MTWIQNARNWGIIIIQQTFQEPPEPAEGEEGEEPPPPVKKLGPHEGSSHLNMRHLARFVTPKIAPTKWPCGMKWILVQIFVHVKHIARHLMEHSSGQALWRSLHSAAMESTLLQEVRLPHSVCHAENESAWSAFSILNLCSGRGLMLLLLLVLLELRFGRMVFSSCGTWSRVKNSWPKQFRRWPRTSGGVSAVSLLILVA